MRQRGASDARTCQKQGIFPFVNTSARYRVMHRRRLMHKAMFIKFGAGRPADKHQTNKKGGAMRRPFNA
jgi:hypothetical protein